MKLILSLMAVAGLSGCVAYGPAGPGYGTGVYYQSAPAYRGYYGYDGVYRRGSGDRDRDGVPNRYDRDRDGDGVPNRRDSNPDNPRRY